MTTTTIAAAAADNIDRYAVYTAFAAAIAVVVPAALVELVAQTWHAGPLPGAAADKFRSYLESLADGSLDHEGASEIRMLEMSLVRVHSISHDLNERRITRIKNYLMAQALIGVSSAAVLFASLLDLW